MKNHGSVILRSEKANPTRTEEFGLTLITILFSAPRGQNNIERRTSQQSAQPQKTRPAEAFGSDSHSSSCPTASSRRTAHPETTEPAPEKPTEPKILPNEPASPPLLRFSHKWFLKSGQTPPIRNPSPCPNPGEECFGTLEANLTAIPPDQNATQKNSLFNRLFKKN